MITLLLITDWLGEQVAADVIGLAAAMTWLVLLTLRALGRLGPSRGLRFAAAPAPGTASSATREPVLAGSPGR